ncbi:Glucosyl transferase GtrII [Butyrivibrio sp. INlla18]|uniref:glucosyltransferase domain-containing protein n=1 Tax=Butyrivibrio sp. INlla18 TaxID=1520806 RepID=UPI00087EDFAF|nr:glucosyltransferase domain-containing protein [Butyrivibrio sp. INlla18]SDA69928.1 Glucosyl transferase GtrII [Butyrivibrio sp. INlla18]
MESKNIIEKNRESLLCVIVTFIIGLLAYGYVFVNFVPAHDGMRVFTNEQYWQLSIGRYMMLYYLKLRGPLNAPWLIGMIALAFISLSVYLCLKILDIKFDLWKVLAISSIFLLNISFIASAATYIYVFDLYSLALLLALSSVFVNIKYDNVFGFFISAFILSLSVGAYQSFFTVAVGLYMILALKKLSEGASCKEVVTKGLIWISNILVSGVFYYICLKIALFINHVKAYHGAYNSVFDVANMSAGSVIRMIPDAYFNLLKTLYGQYTYSTKLVDLLNLAITALGLFLLIRLCRHNCKRLAEKVLFLIIVFLFPLGVGCTYILANGNIHNLMMFSYQLIFVLVLYPLLSDKIKFDKDKILANIRRGGILLVLLDSFFIIRFSNDLFYYKTLVGEGTETAVTNIVYDIEKNSEFDPQNTQIVILGNITNALKSDYDMKYILGNVTGVTTYGTTITYNDVFTWYLDGILGKKYNYVRDGQVISNVEQLAEVKEMPEYPHEGYCAMVDGYMVLKFGE